jgi:TolB-like protein
MDDTRGFAFGEFTFSDHRKELRRNGMVVPLGSRALDVLGCLLRQAGKTVDRDALMAAVWPVRVVEEHNLSVQLSALRRALGDGADGFIHTDPGRGYRFIAPVVSVDQVAVPGQEAPPAPGPFAVRLAATRMEKPSIAALPFDNMTADPEQTYFADGMVEDIITELSRSHSLFVVSRSASFLYRGRNHDIRQVAGELSVRYVLEGSVRASASRVRVNAQLIDAETGGHVWAERYDRNITDMFSVQDEITQAVAMAIEPAVHDAEQIRANRVLPENLGAWEAFHRGMWFLDRMDPLSCSIRSSRRRTPGWHRST